MNSWIDNLIQIDELVQAFRIIVSVLLGAFIGFEREKYGRPAGLRTHMIVSVASTLAMLVSIYGFTSADPARLAAQVISGIGFIGAGTIIRGDKDITGITTASTIWICAIIGLACGAGYYFGAIMTTAFVLIILSCFTKLESKLSKGRKGSSNIVLVLKSEENIVSKIKSLIDSKDIVLTTFEYKHQIMDGEKVVKINMGLATHTLVKNVNDFLSSVDKEFESIQGKLTNERYIKNNN